MTHSGQITIPPSLSTPRPKGLRCSNIKWWAIYKNLPVDVIVRLPHPRSSNSQGQESFLAPSLYKQIRNYDTQFSNHHPSLSTVRSNGLSHSKMKWWAIYKNLPVDVIVRLLHPRRRGSQGLETFLTLSTDKETRNNDTECSNHHPFLSTTRPNGLSRSKTKWWARYTNSSVDVIVRLTHPRRRDSQGQDTYLAPSGNKQSRNYDTQCSNHIPSVSTQRPKALSRSKMKLWATYTNLPVDVIVTLPHTRRTDSQGQETFLAPSADKRTHNYDTECWNHNPFLSSLRPKGFSRSKMKWWAIYTNLRVDVIVRLPHPRRRDSEGQETFLAPSADKQTHNYDIQCSNHHPTLSTLRPKGLSCSNMKWWAIYTNLPVDVIVRLPNPRSRDTQNEETFLAISPESQTRNYNTELSNHHHSLSTPTPKAWSRSKMKWWAIYTNLPMDVIVRLPHDWSRDRQDQQAFWALSPDKLTRNYDTEFSNHHHTVSNPRPKG